jgi:hypothetical protein
MGADDFGEKGIFALDFGCMTWDWNGRGQKKIWVKRLTLGVVCVPASSFGVRIRLRSPQAKTALFTLVFWLPWVFGQKTIRNRCAMRGGGLGGLCEWVPLRSPAGLRPSARWRGSRRERGESRSGGDCFPCSRHAPRDRFAWPALRSWDVLVPFPLDPLEMQGREETSMVGGCLTRDMVSSAQTLSRNLRMEVASIAASSSLTLKLRVRPSP